MRGEQSEVFICPDYRGPGKALLDKNSFESRLENARGRRGSSLTGIYKKGAYM